MDDSINQIKGARRGIHHCTHAAERRKRYLAVIAGEEGGLAQEILKQVLVQENVALLPRRLHIAGHTAAHAKRKGTKKMKRKRTNESGSYRIQIRK